MITTQKIMAMLTGKEIVDTLIAEIIDSSPDFAQDHRRFQEAINFLKSQRDEGGDPTVDALVDAICRQIVSNWLFSCYLGFQANLNHFRNPVARTFMDVDPEIYLREHVARLLPEYAAAQEIVASFCRQIPDEQKEVFEGVAAYISHLDTIVPKAAHYIGFQLGDELLPCVIPGYRPDKQLTARYCMMLEDYLQ